MATSIAVMTVFTVRLCVKREMREGLGPTVIPTRIWTMRMGYPGVYHLILGDDCLLNNYIFSFGAY